MVYVLWSVYFRLVINDELTFDLTFILFVCSVLYFDLTICFLADRTNDRAYATVVGRR